MTFNDKISPALQRRMGGTTGITCGIQPTKKWIGTEPDSLLNELEIATAAKPECYIDCKCLPCKEYNCKECLVEAMFRNGAPREEVLALKERYRADQSAGPYPQGFTL